MDGTKSLSSPQHTLLCPDSLEVGARHPHRPSVNERPPSQLPQGEVVSTPAPSSQLPLSKGCHRAFPESKISLNLSASICKTGVTNQASAPQTLWPVGSRKSEYLPRYTAGALPGATGPSLKARTRWLRGSQGARDSHPLPSRGGEQGAVTWAEPTRGRGGPGRQNLEPLSVLGQPRAQAEQKQWGWWSREGCAWEPALSPVLQSHSSAMGIRRV